MKQLDLEEHTAELAILIHDFGREHGIPPVAMLGLLSLASTQISLAMLTTEEDLVVPEQW